MKNIFFRFYKCYLKEKSILQFKIKETHKDTVQ